MPAFARTRTASVSNARRSLCGLFTACVFASRLALAVNDGASAEPRTPEGPPSLVAGPRLAIGGGLNLGGLVGWFEAGFRITDNLRAGGFVETPIASERLDGDACGDNGHIECIDRYVSFGPRLEFDPFPTSVFSPWVGAELGAVLLFGDNAKPVVPEIGADLGLELRVFRELGVGPYVAMALILVDPYVTDPLPYQQIYVGTPSIGSLGIRIAGRFDASHE